MSIFDKNSIAPDGQEILQEMRSFIAKPSLFIDKKEAINQINSGFFLLRHLPVSRDAVFDHFSKVFGDFVKVYMNSSENDNEGAEDANEILGECHKGFINLLDSCGEIWSPILSAWSLFLLGQFSSQYSSRPIFQRLVNINEVIQFWMSSKAIEILIDLTSRCLNYSDPTNSYANAFISTLLETSRIHSPHFDWVVAHVGNSYPQTVVSKVLSLGLENFSTNPPNVNQLSSVVGILSHLGKTHSSDVQRAFETLIKNTMDEKISPGEAYGIPYLLQLGASSVSLLDVLIESVLPRVKEDSLPKLRRLVPIWIQLHFGGREINFLALVTHIILKSSQGPQALLLLMRSYKVWVKPYSDSVRTILDFFVQEISKIFYQADPIQKDFPKLWPCIPALKEASESIIPFLIDPDQKIRNIAKQLTIITSLNNGKEVGVKGIVFLFTEGNCQEHIWYIIDLVGALELKYPSIFSEALQILEVKVRTAKFDKSFNSTTNGKSTDFLNLWKNILTIVKTENFLSSTGSNSKSRLYKSLKPRYTIRLKLGSALRENLNILTQFIDAGKLTFSYEEAVIIVEILSSILSGEVEVGNEPHKKIHSKTPKEIKNSNFGGDLILERVLVELLFVVLGKIDSKTTKMEKVRVISHINRLLQKICSEIAIQNDALRSLVQTCVDPDCSYLFQSTVAIKKGPDGDEGVYHEAPIENYSAYESLLTENQKRPTNLSLTRTHSTSFHSGKLLKTTLRARQIHSTEESNGKISIRENTHCELNKELFFATLLNVCKASHDGFKGNPQLEPHIQTHIDIVNAMRKVSLLLVEIISPDVMFNGLPWPDEDFSKVLVERDLQIQRSFDDHPYLWDLLELVATYCPSLCYCSVLLRALMATLMGHWTSCQEGKSINYPKKLDSTVRLINIMKIGQLIPPPLSYIGEMVISIIKRLVGEISIGGVRFLTLLIRKLKSKLIRTGCVEFGNSKQKLLKDVLLSYARWNRNVGYCQGFNMIGAIILEISVGDKVNALKIFIYLIEGVLPKDYFTNGLKDLILHLHVFRHILKKRKPSLTSHLQEIQTEKDSPPLIDVFTINWFLTLYLHCLPMNMVLRIWDLIFLEGSEILLRTALVLWATIEMRLAPVTCPDEFYSTMGVVSREMLEFGLGLDANSLVKCVISLGPFPYPGLDVLKNQVKNSLNQKRPTQKSFFLPKKELDMLKKHYDQIRHRQIRPPTIITNSFNVNPNKKPNSNRSNASSAQSNIRQVQQQPKLFNLKCNLPKQNLRIFESASQQPPTTKSTPNSNSRPQNKLPAQSNCEPYQIKNPPHQPPAITQPSSSVAKWEKNKCLRKRSSKSSRDRIERRDTLTVPPGPPPRASSSSSTDLCDSDPVEDSSDEEPKRSIRNRPKSRSRTPELSSISVVQSSDSVFQEVKEKEKPAERIPSPHPPESEPTDLLNLTESLQLNVENNETQISPNLVEDLTPEEVELRNYQLEMERDLSNVNPLDEKSESFYIDMNKRICELQFQNLKVLSGCNFFETTPLDSGRDESELEEWREFSSKTLESSSSLLCKEESIDEGHSEPDQEYSPTNSENDGPIPVDFSVKELNSPSEMNLIIGSLIPLPIDPIPCGLSSQSESGFGCDSVFTSSSTSSISRDEIGLSSDYCSVLDVRSDNKLEFKEEEDEEVRDLDSPITPEDVEEPDLMPENPEVDQQKDTKRSGPDEEEMNNVISQNIAILGKLKTQNSFDKTRLVYDSSSSDSDSDPPHGFLHNLSPVSPVEAYSGSIKPSTISLVRNEGGTEQVPLKSRGFRVKKSKPKPKKIFNPFPTVPASRIRDTMGRGEGAESGGRVGVSGGSRGTKRT